MDPFVKTLLSTDGRDKITKGLQYLGKVLIWTIINKRPSFSYLIPILERIAKVFSDARKIFRLGNWLNNLMKLRLGPNTKDFPSYIGQRMDMISTGTGMVSAFCDDTSYVIKLWTGKSSELNDRIELICNLFWTASLVSEMYNAIPRLWETYL
jgi:hypothetical protein